MILTEKDILQLLTKPLNGDAVVAGVSLQNEHKVHITGEGYERLVRLVDGFESASEFNVRKQISKPATIQITSIIIDNLNRWANAQGTIKKVDFKDDVKDNEYESILSQVWNNSHFDNFIKTFYKDAIFVEFNGFILITKPKIITIEDTKFVDKQGVLSVYNDEPLKPYMIFISAEDVKDFKITGDKVEYLIIKLGNNKYRVIDDENDCVVDYGKNKIINIDSVANEIGYVPAIKISNINKKLLNSQVKTSPIDHILPALDRYFSSDCDLRMQLIKHAYPKLAIVTRDCKVCGGSGQIFDIETKIKCTNCDGTGKEIPISRSGVIGIPQYLQSGDTPYPGAPASYINPETESLRICIDDLERQRKDILYSGTGDKGLVSEVLRDETATSSIISSRSLEDRISEISCMVENFEYFCKKAIKDLYNEFKNIPADQYSITVRYGRRIAVKGESELLDEIVKSKIAGMPMSYIQALQRDLIYSKYKNNSNELQRQLILADVEPFCGYSIDELLKISDIVNAEDMWMKLNFDSLIDEFEAKNTIQYFSLNSLYAERIYLIKQELLKLKKDAIL